MKQLPKTLEILDITESPEIKTCLQRIKLERPNLQVIAPPQENLQEQLREALQRKVLFQPQAIEAVLPSMLVCKRGPSKKTPHGLILLVGPTGVGKTELANAIADALGRLGRPKKRQGQH